ncbi:MAG: DNA-binding protein [Gammaproteobacteria bacterium]|nr:DNA-binding protein [Gammaproteobacteria bacterium]
MHEVSKSGQSNRVYGILNRRHPLTLKMIRGLNQEPGMPAESLIRPTQVRTPEG